MMVVSACRLVGLVAGGLVLRGLPQLALAIGKVERLPLRSMVSVALELLQLSLCRGVEGAFKGSPAVLL